MNEKFLILLLSKGWQVRDSKQDYVKIYEISLGNDTLNIPISARFYNLNKDGFPQGVTYQNVLNPAMFFGVQNRRTIVKGMARIIASVEYHAGMIAALKFVLYSNPTNYFTKYAKAALTKVGKLT
jgi:hypothetical protein